MEILALLGSGSFLGMWHHGLQVMTLGLAEAFHMFIVTRLTSRSQYHPFSVEKTPPLAGMVWKEE